MVDVVGRSDKAGAVAAGAGAPRGDAPPVEARSRESGWCQRLRSAARLSLMCLGSAALGTVLYQPLTYLHGAWTGEFGKGVVASASFRNRTRMLAHEPFVVHNNDTTVFDRAGYIFQGLPQWVVLLGALPLFYAKYLGGSARTHTILIGTAVLCYLFILGVYAITNFKLLWQLGPALGLMALVLNLRFMLPPDCAVASQVTIQMAVTIMGNALISYRFFPETSVRPTPRHAAKTLRMLACRIQPTNTPASLVSSGLSLCRSVALLHCCAVGTTCSYRTWHASFTRS
jgi:hypothetical protein